MEELLANLSSFSILPAVILIVLTRSSVKFDFGAVLKITVIVYLLSDLTIYLMAEHGYNNMPVIHAFTVIEFTLLTIIYKSVLDESVRKYLSGLIIFFAIFSIVNVIWIQDILAFNSWGRMIESFFLVILSLLWFLKIFREMVIEKLSSHPMFYINSGVLLYFAGNFFIFTYYNVMVNQFHGVMNEIWQIHSILNIIYSLMLAAAVWKMRAKYQLE